MTDNDARQPIDQFKQARIEHLRGLELKAAQYGELETPVSILNEIDRVKREIADAHAVMLPSSRAQLIGAMDDTQRAIHLERISMDTQQRVMNAASDAKEARLTAVSARDRADQVWLTLTTDGALRVSRQHRQDLWLGALSAIVLAILAITVYRAIRDTKR